MVLVLSPETSYDTPSALVPKIHRSKPARIRLCRNTVYRSLFLSLSLYRTSRRMCPAAIQPTLSCSFNLKATSPSSFCHKKLLVSLKNPVIPSRYPCQLNIGSPFSISAASAFSSDTLNPDSISPNPSSRKKKLGVVVKPMEKPRLVLKFIWMQKNIGISIDQVIPGYGTIPLSPYYFWPRKDAWEELKTLLERKSWISQKQMVVLLNQATDIINLWQQSGGDFT